MRNHLFERVDFVIWFLKSLHKSHFLCYLIWYNEINTAKDIDNPSWTSKTGVTSVFCIVFTNFNETSKWGNRLAFFRKTQPQSTGLKEMSKRKRPQKCSIKQKNFNLFMIKNQIEYQFALIENLKFSSPLTTMYSMSNHKNKISNFGQRES